MMRMFVLIRWSGCDDVMMRMFVLMWRDVMMSVRVGIR